MFSMLMMYILVMNMNFCVNSVKTQCSSFQLHSNVFQIYLQKNVLYCCEVFTAL